MNKKMMMGIFAIAAWLSVSNPLIASYIGKMKMNTVAALKQEDPLVQEIKKNASKYEIPPSDAKVDPIWKAIPGYNGQSVNILSSYKNMKKAGIFRAEKLVFEQLKPKVHLQDLPPAPIYKGHPDKPMVSFAINVAWGNEYLSSILATLKKHNITASFFLEGNWVKKNPELAKMISATGHEIGNHSYYHSDMKRLSAEGTRQELIKTNEVIKAVTGKKCGLFAPPSGSFREETTHIAHELNMKMIMWSVDTIDWQKPSPETIIDRVGRKVENGSIILMHPTDSTSRALDRLIVLIEKKNLSIGTVSELMKEDRIIENDVKK